MGGPVVTEWSSIRVMERSNASPDLNPSPRNGAAQAAPIPWIDPRRLPARSAAVWMMVVLLGTGCSRTRAIAEILGDPRGFDGKTVVIQGVVTGGANLVVFKGFKVRDATGEIAVVTERAVPRPGQTVRVKGRIEQALALNDASLVVLFEDPPR